MDGELLEIERAHQAFEAGVHFDHEARGAGVDLNADKFHLLAQADRVGGIAGKAIDVFNQDYIEVASLGILDQAKQRLAAVQACA